MKIPLSFGFVAAVSGALLACSSDSGTPRNSTGGTAGTGQVGNAGTSNAGSGGSSGTGSGGTGSGGTGSGGTSGSGLTLGAALDITADGVVSDTQGTTGINGGTPVLVTSMANSTPSTMPVLSFKAGAICVKGATVALPAMPAGADYTANWGFSVQLDLNRGANPNASTADAGADAGDAGAVLGQVAEPWDPKAHNVIGFSFKLTGNDPTITAGQGVPAQMRLQTLPTGGDPATDSYCASLTTASGTEESVTFDKMFYQCYNSPPGRAVFADPLPAGFSGSLQNLQWQINSASSLAFQVDFCLSDIQPILGN